EHPHVFTLGKSGKPEHLLLNEEQRRERAVAYYKINRGGDITYHGPGQIVAYPIFDLDGFFTDVHRYVRYLEEVVIRTLATFGLQGIRMPDYTGVWLEAGQGQPYRKICAIGVHLSRWVTMHGFALNVNTNLDYFNYIVPCGIDEADKAVTSMQRELGQPLDRSAVLQEVKQQFKALFEFEYVHS
ncbi:MAG: lipoyl(octanoyl) transferase LipB, partial [Phaeodactylibacter sp.]|nr:lipoyl(octanoyl) transferase LipB [Phaeodactylibacter sp.]